MAGSFFDVLIAMGAVTNITSALPAVVMGGAYSLWGTGFDRPNKSNGVKAGVKSYYGVGLPMQNELAKSVWHGYAKKLDTCRPV